VTVPEATLLPRAPSAGAEPPLIEARNLSVSFGRIRVVDGISFRLDPGEVLGIVGESGSGKSMTALALLRLVPPGARIAADRLAFMGEDLLGASETRMEALRGASIAMIFQEPMTALNPVLTVGHQIVEVLRRHLGLAAREARERAIAALARVGIPAPAERIDDYPHQLSGGMRQRVMIAMALACRPKLLIADEPTTALDVTIQAQILELLLDLQAEYRMGIVLISHDLGIVSSFADRALVMYAGEIVEEAPAEALFARPAHPYAEALLASIPDAGRDLARLRAIEGTVPPPFDLPPGCRFAPRCAHARPACTRASPPLIVAGPGQRAACIRSTGYAVP
jgi:oligopeptide/dipeptide ABC transporter ATP-binding protein